MAAGALQDRLADVVAEQAQRDGGAVWVRSARDDRTVDRAELARVAAAWAAHGVAGRRIGLVVADPVAFAVLFVSLIAAGATVVPLDPAAPAESRWALLRTAGATGVVTSDGSDAAGDAAALGLDAVLARASDHLPVAPAPGAPAPGATEPVAVGSEAGASLLFSSGSTGTRKAMRLPQAQLLHVARAVAGAHALTPADRAFNTLPLFHVNAEVVALLATLVSGGSVTLDARFRRTGFWELVSASGATWVNAVPAIIAILAADTTGPGGSSTTSTTSTVHPALTSRVRFVRSASAPLPVPVLERFEAATGLTVIETYGMTEAASQITANPLDAPRTGTVGRPTGVELRVVAEDGTPAGSGVTGRIHLRGPGVITRYEGGVGTDRFDEAGWLDTGDVGSLDADGYLTLAGRSDDIINRGGEKIFPREVEEVLRQHPGVAEAVVVGRPDPVLGHVPVAYVIATTSATDTEGTGSAHEDSTAREAFEGELLALCARSLARSHRPVELHLVDDLPLGPTGKLSRRLVADRFASLPGA